MFSSAWPRSIRRHLPHAPDQFVALVVAQLSGRASLRDLEQPPPPRLYHLGARVAPRSSLSRVNAEQPYSLYEALCAKLLERCSALAPRHGFRFKHKLYTLDSSFIELSLTVFPWASYKAAKGAAKLHVGLDHEGYLPAFVSLTDGQTSDIAEARRRAWPRGSMVVCDKGSTPRAVSEIVAASEQKTGKQVEQRDFSRATRKRSSYLAASRRRLLAYACESSAPNRTICAE